MWMQDQVKRILEERGLTPAKRAKVLADIKEANPKLHDALMKRRGL